MSSVPMIAAEAAITEGRVGDPAHEVVGAEQGAEADQAVEAEHATEDDCPDKVERGAEAEHAARPVDTSSSGDPANAKAATATQEEQVEELVHEAEGGDTDDVAHATEPESVLLSVSSADNETNAIPTVTEPPSVVATEAEV